MNFANSNYLTPYRCYTLPEHYRLLLRQLLLVTNRGRAQQQTAVDAT